MCANIISLQISFLWGQLWKDCVLKGTSPSQGIEIYLWIMIQMNLKCVIQKNWETIDIVIVKT
jgi:hypothetical protein